MAENKKLSVTEAARVIGVVPKTIVRWEQSGKIRKAKRDWRNWRIYTEDDVVKLREFHDTIRFYE